MFAAGTTAPLGSVTVPTMVPDLICASATPQQSTVMAMRAQNFVEVARPIVDIRSRPPVANSFVWGPSQPLRSGFVEVNSCRVREEKCGGGNVTRRESRNSIQKIGVSLAEMRARTESALKQGARCYKKDAIRRQVPNGGFIGMGTTQCAALACGKYRKSAAGIEKPAAASA